MMKINIEYFAKLREERGCSSEVIETSASTVGEMYKLLQEKYKFSIPFENLKVAINENFSNWNEKINDNDTVVFIQPVAGG
ncbi:MAG: MoaD/ThiS family protein [Candidatus Sericytochromatia bacterium]|nr:MoaD/ThiS family protein [Candidatus Sericytochromatia bacterium]